MNRTLVSENNGNLSGTRTSNSESLRNFSRTHNGRLKVRIAVTYIGEIRFYWAINPPVSNTHCLVCYETWAGCLPCFHNFFFFLTEHSDLSETSKRLKTKLF